MEFLERRREGTFDDHADQIVGWLEFDQSRRLESVLVYASLEMRCAIERYLFEFLVICNEGRLPEEDVARCQTPDGLFALVEETLPLYRKTAEFTQLIVSLSPGAPPVPILELDVLREGWRDLEPFVRPTLGPPPPEPERSEAIARGYERIAQLLDRLVEWDLERVCAIVDPATMPPEAQTVFEQYVTGDLGAEAARERLRLMEPVLRARHQYLDSLGLND